ncbi:MAG: PAS domain S-box protein, partial [Anaerolineae bacterium]
MPIPLRVLLLEDRATDAELVIESLREHDYEPDWVRVDTEADFRAQLDEPWELILADYSLPQFSGPAALKIVHDLQLDIPVIIVSGTVGEDTAVAALKLGAADYLLKDRLARLGAAVAHALEQQRLRDEKRRSERRFQALIEHSPDGIALMDADGHMLYTGPSTERILGYRAEELAGRAPTEMFHPDDWPELQALFQDLLQWPNAALKIEYRFRHRDGTWHWLEGTITNLLHEPSVAAMVLNYRDVTERKQAEARIAQLAAVIDQAAETIVVTDLDGNIVYVNPFFTTLTGYTRDDVLGQNPRLLSSGLHDRAFYQKLWETITQGGTWKGELINRRSDGRLYYEEA